ncbi:NADH-quinone oxidoreductase subunit J [Mucilaginibacter corticis]|uniref:NADH-quinone oxidoreductase subunit J n=1 Tax=Mucilaginibacter corticis TaxID=2597670 RepID=A0A556MF62_9SPHI|nr:NADH-quinone oxidoreductase subunit J [Mucilaginibacter corticis]TSJ38574.1 NADH-quinone oxidoreductase subunit J [Mucilaginibacter corticis]
MNIAQVIFYVMAFVVIASALFVASSKNLVRSIFMFFITLFGLAGLYVLALADFVAVTQIVIYVGGVLVLILFAFMLSGKETLGILQQQKGKFISVSKLPALLLAALFFVVMVNVVLKTDVNNLPWIKQVTAANAAIKPNDLMIDNIGINLMTRYLLPFEAISILLMMALVGAAHLARKERGAI